MAKFSFRGIRKSADHTDWLFSGPEEGRIYGLSVNRQNGNYYAYWQPAGAPDNTDEMPISAKDARALVALKDRACNPVSRTLDEIAALLTSGEKDAAVLRDASERLSRIGTLAGSLYESAESMLGAYGGDTPDWIREEASKVEDDLTALRKAAPPIKEAEPDTAPSPAPAP